MKRELWSLDDEATLRWIEAKQRNPVRVWSMRGPMIYLTILLLVLSAGLVSCSCREGENLWQVGCYEERT